MIAHLPALSVAMPRPEEKATVWLRRGRGPEPDWRFVLSISPDAQ
jgi:hypothetical protein